MSVRVVFFNFLKTSPEVGHDCECGVTIKEASGRFNLVSLDTTVPHAQVLNLEVRIRVYFISLLIAVLHELHENMQKMNGKVEVANNVR